MRMMMKVKMPVLAGNKAIKEGVLPKTMNAFIEKYKPQGAYFTTECGQRTAFFFFDMKDATDMPSVAEPFFMNLEAAIEWAPAMDVDDLKKGLEKAMKG